MGNEASRSESEEKMEEIDEGNDAVEVDSSVHSNSDDKHAKMEGSSRHKSRKRPHQASDSARTVKKTKVQGRDGLEFIVSMTQTLQARDEMTVPKHFAYAFDTSEKKYVILSTDKGDFRLNVRNYHRARGKNNASLIVLFSNGWRDFYQQNRLSVGMKCLFKMKEQTLNGDASGFSMNVTVLAP